MGKRGTNAFRRNDAIRALESARDGGLDPAMMEVIVDPNGTVAYRVYADRVVPPAAEPIMRSAKEWDAEIAKLKEAKTPPKGGSGQC
jgi:hypothetical protein